ncbi:MAG: PAS domain-containing sensor histidine kinase [Magnetococcales bacterium]|nr:PAS domain-containing sensor histidine kinase [Magnetococcales bacterium]MBF0321879.1 PAS domain-containing sensor histidine kinase [Magnetococcales bacterium]
MSDETTLEPPAPETGCCIPLVEQNPDGVVVMQPDGKILYANPAAELLFGQERGKMPGGSLGFPTTPGDNREITIPMADHPPRIAELRTVRFTQNEGEPLLAAIFRDVTERRRLEQDLMVAKERAETGVRAKNRFLASMSHELRTPLNAIIGLTSLLLGRGSGPLTGLQEEFLRDVYRSGHHLLSLIDDILNWSHLARGEIDLKLSQVPVGEFLAERLAEACEEAEEKEILLTGDWSRAPRLAPMDENLISRVVHALLSNAIKFTPERGKIFLQAQRLPADDSNGKPQLRVSVTDTGIGLTSEEIDRIFEPFDQADEHETIPYAGCGVGLSLTRSLVELHGGRIWVESPGRQQGSTFTFLLPV